MSTVVYGNEIAQKRKQILKEKLALLLKEKKRLPHLVVVLVGENPASMSYVRGKEKACQEVGMENTMIKLPETVSQDELLNVIDRLNEDESVDGILVQLPLPKHIDEERILLNISADKDVDGFHPYNIGCMMMGKSRFLPCTPKGIMVMLEEMGLDDLSGKQAVVIGRSNIVGKPAAQLLLEKNATVTICHSRTADIKEITKRADILIAAVGKAKLIDKDWVKPGAAVIDVGINRDENNKLCGDVDFESVKDLVSFITPVPKGVGPMTIAMLLENTLEAYLKKQQ